MSPESGTEGNGTETGKQVQIEPDAINIVMVGLDKRGRVPLTNDVVNTDPTTSPQLL